MSQPLQFDGSTEITGEGIKKHFRRYESWQPLFELAWNGLDAQATEVKILISRNELGSLEQVVVLDNGNGIDFLNIKNNFGKFNESLKSQSADQHGSHGRGRLAFHRLCHEAAWYPRHHLEDAKISISSANIKRYQGEILAAPEQHALLSGLDNGTLVVLHNFMADLPSESELFRKLSVEFGWYLALNPQVKLEVNGRLVTVPSHDIKETLIKEEGHEFRVRAIRWDQSPSSEKSYNYLLTSKGKIRYRELSSFNRKPNFYISVYVISEWADQFDSEEEDLLSPNGFSSSSQVWRSLATRIKDFTKEIYEEFLRNFVDTQMARFEEEGVFPEYPNENAEYAAWKRNNTKALVRSIYIADPAVFTNLKKKQRKIIVRLLDKISISSENDSLFDVLESVLDLDSQSIATFSDQLKRTRLEHIVSTIELFQKREIAIARLREIMEYHYKEVLETPDLQRIIENNTWMFGPSYEILGAEEDTFSHVAKKLRDSVRGIHEISNDDLEGDADPEGANRQADLFLARKTLTFDARGQQVFKCVLIEIKRPSIALNNTHLRQLDDYAAILNRHPEFNSQKMRFELILVGRTISDRDYEIKSRIEGYSSHGEPGLVGSDSKIKRYVKTWYTIFDEFNISSDYLVSTLKTQRETLSSYSAPELVESLQAGRA